MRSLPRAILLCNGPLQGAMPLSPKSFSLPGPILSCGTMPASGRSTSLTSAPIRNRFGQCLWPRCRRSAPAGIAHRQEIGCSSRNAYPAAARDSASTCWRRGAGDRAIVALANVRSYKSKPRRAASGRDGSAVDRHIRAASYASRSGSYIARSGAAALLCRFPGCVTASQFPFVWLGRRPHPAASPPPRFRLDRLAARGEATSLLASCAFASIGWR